VDAREKSIIYQTIAASPSGIVDLFFSAIFIKLLHYSTSIEGKGNLRRSPEGGDLS
jgi:hypothetical protein